MQKESKSFERKEIAKAVQEIIVEKDKSSKFPSLESCDFALLVVEELNQIYDDWIWTYTIGMHSQYYYIKHIPRETDV